MISHVKVSVCAISAFLLLSGCGEQELSSCLTSTEPLIWSRQMASPGRKELMDDCFRKGWSEDYCAGLYVNADTLVRVCMADKGYTFTNDVCRFAHFRDPKCYRSKWFLMLPASIRNEISKPYVPSEGG